MFPTSIRLVLMALRIRSAVPPQRWASSLCKASRRWHSRAAAQASTAWRSLGTGAPQKAITPSPMNLSIVPQWFRTALETSEHYRQRLLVPAGASLDALGDQCADQFGRHVLLERREPSAHLQQDARKLVELAQWR